MNNNIYYIKILWNPFVRYIKIKTACLNSKETLKKNITILFFSHVIIDIKDLVNIIVELKFHLYMMAYIQNISCQYEMCSKLCRMLE